jgi:hypothetical protein
MKLKKIQGVFTSRKLQGRERILFSEQFAPFLPA